MNWGKGRAGESGLDDEDGEEGTDHGDSNTNHLVDVVYSQTPDNETAGGVATQEQILAQQYEVDFAPPWRDTLLYVHITHFRELRVHVRRLPRMRSVRTPSAERENLRRGYVCM